MPVIRAVLFSVLVHSLLIGAILWLAPLLQIPSKETIEVQLFPEGQILEALTPNKQQIVRQALVPEKMKAPDDETLARFLSEQKQRVRQEQRAAQSGMTSNRANQPGPVQEQKTQPQRQAQKRAQEKVEKADDGWKEMDITQDLAEMNRYSDGLSTIGESMPRDMKVGSFTALNTDRYLFYTFYARMEELIRYRWESRVQSAINSFDRPTLALAGNRNWITHVEFLLDKNGYLRSALIMKESGIRAFDAAAINAFKEAKVFPNPPQEMVQDDGFIHIKFSFTVNYAPPTLVNRN
ncbi:TonB family protein [Bdellovibrio sp. 22V]|uniref:cell envelope integrity protein TolA n=1 Tax=Bdellovibrio TaxID=958 RepID=UPI002543DB19|nr:TonB family protein [Bdellovibrio sp. 22V]WII73512.1 TonB family protein [Bdellovibrio sp. 22V]